LEGMIEVKATETQQDIRNDFYCDNLTNSQRLQEERCCVCMDTPTKPKQLRKCGHIFCKECIEQCFNYKPACPICGTIYGKVTGDQPLGTMSIRTNGSRLQGFNDSSGTIILTYFFNDGLQGEEHPNPRTVYKGIRLSGYLPNNKKGRLIAKLLNVAFSRRLVFTIGWSRTTGHDGVTWNAIHHKTSMEGGPARFGYPDPTYLDSVLEELKAKGVTEESADDPEEYKEYSREIRY
uniref:E3 ubiquitin-protein ligase n=1 Tax=Magallana gigas TaxID=29159 RepID=A0A8W8K4H8_MAGGI